MTCASHKSSVRFSARFAAAAFALFLSALALPVEVSAQQTMPSARQRVPLTLTSRDVSASTEKVAQAYGALVAMWSSQFDAIGARFAVPRIQRYRGAVDTPCGTIAPSNASYCMAANTIFFDDVFLASQALSAGRELGTDGDMVAVGIIAHEMGHAVAMQLGYRSADSYWNEAVADCLAGSFAKQSAADGSLEPGDVEEAFFGMAAAGDPVPTATGNVRRDRMVAGMLAQRAHGSRDQRMANFKAGLDNGSGICLAEFR